jgi:prepilin-type N-terminal cleavage/methylation domain-containing protein
VGQRLRTIRRNDSGFTLTELLIVIVILGVLAGIVLLAVGGFTDRGEKSACKAAMKTTEVAVETYRANNSGKAPATLQVLVDGGYLKELPSNPSTKYTISYDFNGKDGLPNTADDGVVTGYVADATKTDCSA